MGSPTHDADATTSDEGAVETEKATEAPVEVNTQGGDAVVNTAEDGGGVDNEAAPSEDTAADTTSDTDSTDSGDQSQ